MNDHKPAPRVDTTGVPWCTQLACPRSVPKEPDKHPHPNVTVHGTMAHCSITGDILDDEPCLPAIREMHAELVQLRTRSCKVEPCLSG